MKLKYENKIKEIEFFGKVKELLKKENINPETVVVVKNGEVISEDERVNNDEELELISVVSGG
ncbi:MAG TPA: MoaD/ThiS family protein [Candidatus Woesearchaeota archaeon]|jgi:sulfur carrier protein|nr:MoaD/ThiS family protein [Candidatus Woesearchaeota archaeon]